MCGDGQPFSGFQCSRPEGGKSELSALPQVLAGSGTRQVPCLPDAPIVLPLGTEPKPVLFPPATCRAPRMFLAAGQVDITRRG